MCLRNRCLRYQGSRRKVAAFFMRRRNLQSHCSFLRGAKKQAYCIFIRMQGEKTACNHAETACNHHAAAVFVRSTPPAWHHKLMLCARPPDEPGKVGRRETGKRPVSARRPRSSTRSTGSSSTWVLRRLLACCSARPAPRRLSLGEKSTY